MRACQNCGHTNVSLKRCVQCRKAWYCNTFCQTCDWPVHKHVCIKIDLEKCEQTQAHLIASGQMQFKFINDRLDRSVQTHGNDTRPMMKISKALSNLTSALKSNVVIMTRPHQDYTLPYGRCFKNAALCVQNHGGKVLYGWSLWEGRYMIEAEPHAVWSADGTFESAFNVTIDMHGRVYGGLFVVDATLDNYMKQHQKVPSNVVLWK